MKLGAIVNEHFHVAFETLSKEKLPTVISFQVKQIKKVLDLHRSDYVTEFTNLLNLYTSKKEDGSMNVTPRGEPLFHPNNAKLFNEANNELAAIEVATPKIKFASLPADTKLSADDLAALEQFGVLEMPEEAELVKTAITVKAATPFVAGAAPAAEAPQEAAPAEVAVNIDQAPAATDSATPAA